MKFERRWHENNVPAARALRRPLTETEAILWANLRGRGLNGWKFRRQHPVGQFVLDFYCQKAQLAVEVDGSVHMSPEAYAADRLRQEIIEEAGIRFVRVTNGEVECDLARVLKRIDEACAIDVGNDEPSPSGRGLGEGGIAAS